MDSIGYVPTLLNKYNQNFFLVVPCKKVPYVDMCKQENLHSLHIFTVCLYSMLNLLNLKYMEFSELRKNICLRKYQVSVERISVCNVTVKLMEHGIHCLPCSDTSFIDLLS